MNGLTHATVPHVGRPRIIVITGNMAAGKSTVAQALAERVPRSVHLRGDLFRRMIVNGRAEPDLLLRAHTPRIGFWLDSSDLSVAETVAAIVARLKLAAVDDA